MPSQMSPSLTKHTPVAPSSAGLPAGSFSETRIDSPMGGAEPGHAHLAREIYEHILEAQPDHLESLKQLGQMEIEQGEYGPAIEKLSKAVEVSPEDAETLNFLGQAYSAQGDSINAENALRRAVSLNPSLTESHFQLGMALQQQNKLGEAAGSFQQTLRLDRHHSRAYNQLGSTLEEQGNLDGAMVCYQEALVKELIRDAYEIGMLQLREEIDALARFVLVTNPQNVMEIGSHHGGTMYLWCKLLKNEGKRISLDLPGGQFGGLSDEDVDRRNKRMQEWSSNLSIIGADSHDVSTFDKVSELLGEERLDFLFIDGDHTYEGVKLDFFMYRNLVRPGGFIAFHDIKDTELHRQQNCHVNQLWDELTGDKMDIRSEGEWGGIGIVQC